MNLKILSFSRGEDPVLLRRAIELADNAGMNIGSVAEQLALSIELVRTWPYDLFLQAMASLTVIIAFELIWITGSIVIKFHRLNVRSLLSITAQL